jgi:serine/threonine protein kinase
LINNQELNVMNNLSHPNVVQLIGVSAQFKQDNPQSFYFGIVLELCSDSLQKTLQKKRWSFGERMRMALELVHGISYVHSMGVLHRDLSSQNILVTSEAHIKIADFGCARRINDRGEYMTSSITGSPAYMAPEQLEGRVLTLKCDVWAVGVNLWELATQKLPWADEAMRESPNGLADYEYCRRKVRNGKMSRPASGQLNSSVAEGYYQIILGCHQKDPAQRLSTQQLLTKYE